jgi:MarR family transcriptional regulator, transcriptional regulator for hemolysin
MSAAKPTSSLLAHDPCKVGFALKTATRLYSMNFERHARELGLTLSQCRVLVHLSRSEGLSQARLSECTETDPMTLVRVLDRMEQEDWIERRPDPADRRAHCLYLKDAAKPVLARIGKIADQATKEALAGISATDCESLIYLLDRIQLNLAALDTHNDVAADATPVTTPQRRKI